jgi:ribokinase
VITVVGVLAWRAAEPSSPAGRACAIALAAAAAGARVELVGRVGDDPAGDALLLALARASVGHATVLRDPARPTPIIRAAAEADDDDPFAEPLAVPAEDGLASPPDGPRLEAADVALGLRYLTGFDVLVLTDDVPAGVLPVAVEAAAFAGARLVTLVPPGGGTAPVVGQALVLEAPSPDDGAFAALVGTLAAGLDRGLAPEDALRLATRAGGWEAVAGEA